MRTQRRLRAAALVALPFLVVTTVSLLPAPAAAGTQAVVNACKSNATGNWSDIEWTITGTATPNPATVGTDPTVTLSGGSVSAQVPGSILIAGYNLGLLTTGSNNIPTTVYVARAATNVDVGGGVGGTVVRVDTLDFTATTTITDPNGVPGTGDETATPIAISQPLPDMTVTPTGGNIEFRQAGPGSLPTIPAGTAGPGAVTPLGSVYTISRVAGGIIKANFDCQPGTSAADGTSFTAAGSWPAFETVTVSGGTPASTTTSTSTTSTSTSTTSTSTTTTAVPTTTTLPKSPDPVTGSRTYTTTCANTVNRDLSQIDFTLTGTVPGQVAAGDKVTLSNHSWKVAVPGSVLDVGLNLGLITLGQSVPGTLTGSVFATNTAEGKLDAAPATTAFGPVALDSAGKAQSVTSTFAMPNMVWTAVGGPVALSMATSSIEVTVGPIKVKFTCDPGTSPAAFVAAGVLGTTNIPAAARPADATVLGASTTAGGAAAGGETLAATGLGLAAPTFAALTLIDLGYLALSATRARRRRPRS